MILDWPKALARKGPHVTLSDLHMAMHSHHYNINLQKMLEDNFRQDGTELMIRAAEEASFFGFQSILHQYNQIKTIKSKLELVSTLYQNCGLGIIHFQKIGPKGGSIISMSSHHVIGWLAKHGRRTTPGCHFSRGWIAGVLEVIYNRPIGYYLVEEKTCKMMLDEKCLFMVKEG